MKKVLFISMPIMILMVYGFIQRGNNSSYYEDAGQDAISVTGNMLYQKNCAACHGIDSKGNLPTFPSLVDIGNRMDRSQIINQLSFGKNAMPSFAHLTKDEREAITGYLLGENTKVEFATEVTPLENGKSLFVANCARCHKATPDDSQPPEQRDWGMKPAQLGGISVKYQFDEFENILNSGPCYMPSFESLTVTDKGDIYSYLKTMEDIYVRSGGSMGMGCRKQCRNRN